MLAWRAINHQKSLRKKKQTGRTLERQSTGVWMIINIKVEITTHSYPAPTFSPEGFWFEISPRETFFCAMFWARQSKKTVHTSCGFPSKNSVKNRRGNREGLNPTLDKKTQGVHRTDLNRRNNCAYSSLSPLVSPMPFVLITTTKNLDNIVP